VIRPAIRIGDFVLVQSDYSSPVCYSLTLQCCSTLFIVGAAPIDLQSLAVNPEIAGGVDERRFWPRDPSLRALITGLMTGLITA
jgi:hypothetical protein